MDKDKIREALETGLNYVLNSGYSRHKDDEKMEIMDAISELDTDDWINVTDMLPDEGETVDIWHPEYGRITDVLFSYNRFSSEEKDIYTSPDVVTHWQPLPSNPKE